MRGISLSRGANTMLGLILKRGLRIDLGIDPNFWRDTWPAYLATTISTELCIRAASVSRLPERFGNIVRA